MNRRQPVNSSAAADWGRLYAIRPVQAFDALFAAAANLNGSTHVIRNAPDIAGLSINVLKSSDAKASAAAKVVASVFLEGIPFILDLIEGAFGGRHGEGFGGLESPDFGIWKH